MAKDKKEKPTKLINQSEYIDEDGYISASYITDRPKLIVPTLPALDVQLGGGIPESGITLIFSEPKIGKTMLGLQVIANGQKMGKVGVIVDVEHRLKKMNLNGIKGLDLSPDKLKIIMSSPGNILSGEDICMRAEQALHKYPGCIMLFDSFTMLQMSNQQTNNYGEFVMGGSSKLQTQFVLRVMPIISVNKNIIIGIMHLNANIGGYGGAIEGVAKRVQYAHDIKIKGKKPEAPVKFEWSSSDSNDGKWIGQRVEWEVITSGLGARGGKCISHLKYGEGYAPEMDIIQMGCDLGIIEKGGAWYNLPNQNGERIKIQGLNEVYNYLVANPEKYEELNNQVRSMLYES